MVKLSADTIIEGCNFTAYKLSYWGRLHHFYFCDPLPWFEMGYTETTYQQLYFPYAVVRYFPQHTALMIWSEIVQSQVCLGELIKKGERLF